MGTVCKLRLGQGWACSSVISPSSGLSPFFPGRGDRTCTNALLRRPSQCWLAKRTCAGLTSAVKQRSSAKIRSCATFVTKSGDEAGESEWSQSRLFRTSAWTKQAAHGVTFQTGSVPDQARVVICGGGVMGCSIAYHLAEAGWTDVLVLEQGR